MKTRKYKQRGGSQDPFDTQDKHRLRIAGFTNEQIKLLNRIKRKYDCPVLDHVDAIVGMIDEHLTDPTAFTMSVKNQYMPDNGQDTDIETDDDDDETQLGGKKRTRRKRRSRYSTKRETRRRRKPFKRTRGVRKIYRKTRKFK
jgi:hypothetical protein